MLPELASLDLPGNWFVAGDTYPHVLRAAHSRDLDLQRCERGVVLTSPGFEKMPFRARAILVGLAPLGMVYFGIICLSVSLSLSLSLSLSHIPNMLSYYCIAPYHGDMTCSHVT